MKMEAQPNQDLPAVSTEGEGSGDKASKRMYDELGHGADTKKCFGNGDTKGGCRPQELLPNLLLESRENRNPSSVNLGSDLRLHGADSPIKQVFSSGDSLGLIKGHQTLVLAGGDRIHLNAAGALTMTDAEGNVASVIEKRLTPPDMMPVLLSHQFSNGARMSSAGDLRILRYPNGTTVYLDETGLRAIDRDSNTNARIQLDTQRPDFEFRGFK